MALRSHFRPYPEEKPFVSQGAKLCLDELTDMRIPHKNALTLLPLIVVLVVPGCSSERNAARDRITPEYGKDGRLQLLKYDSQGNGRVDTWSYMDGARVIRIEIDADADGTIDRWEHYGSDQKLERIGLSRGHDGVEDAWSFTGRDGTVERIEVSTRHDGAIDRIEYYEHDRMVRAEEDSDANGAIDKWETYDGPRLSSVAFDTSDRGIPDRRLTYDLSGAARLEFDRDGDGHLLPVPAAPPAASTSWRPGSR